MKIAEQHNNIIYRILYVIIKIECTCYEKQFTAKTFTFLVYI